MLGSYWDMTLHLDGQVIGHRVVEGSEIGVIEHDEVYEHDGVKYKARALLDTLSRVDVYLEPFIL